MNKVSCVYELTQGQRTRAQNRHRRAPLGGGNRVDGGWGGGGTGGPAGGCREQPDVAGGTAATSSHQPHRFEAIRTRIQYRGSEEPAVSTPYSGTWQHTRKMSRVSRVHRTFSRNCTWPGEGEGGGCKGSASVATLLRPKFPGTEHRCRGPRATVPQARDAQRAGTGVEGREGREARGGPGPARGGAPPSSPPFFERVCGGRNGDGGAFGGAWQTSPKMHTAMGARAAPSRTRRSGVATSGRRGITGLTRSRKRI